MNEQEHARIERLRAERAAAGLPPYIENEAVYRLLAAVADANAAKTHRPGSRFARYSTKDDAQKT